MPRIKLEKLKLILLILVISSFFGITFQAQSAPNVTSVSGVIVDRENIIISGENFGDNGPDIILFDDFHRGVEGAQITMDATRGSWTGFDQSYTPYYGKSFNNNITGYLIDDDHQRQLHIDFNDVTEVFLSYNVIIPPGKHFPHSFAANTFPEGSQWKMSWIMDGERGYKGNDDICIPTWGNGIYFLVGGNDNAFQVQTGYPNTDTNWFSFNGWNRFSTYMKGGIIPDVDQGIFWAQGMSTEFGQKIFEDTPVLFDGDDSPDGYDFSDDNVSRWNRLNIPGWQREGDPDAGAMYDNIYFAIGENAAARVEVGNSAIYNEATKLAILPINSWNNGEINATYYANGIFDSTDSTYLFVIDKNNISSAGYPVSVIYSSSFRADVDQNSAITSTDAMLTLRKSLGLDMSNTNWNNSSTETGDVNCNNSVTTADALLLLRQSVGLGMSNTKWCGG